MRRAAMLALAVLVGVTLTACPDEAPDAVERATGVYERALAWVVDERLGPPPTDDEGEPVDRLVFVESLGPELDLQVQVELVGRFEAEGVELRFIDARTEAVLDQEPGVPVRGDGTLVGLGPIPEGARVDLRVEVYRHATDIEAWRLRMARRAGIWQIVDDPVEVDPEGFVTSP
jgi:hypothetical protein